MKELFIAGLIALLFSSPVFAQVGAAENSGDWWSRARNFESKFYVGKTDLPADQAQELIKHMDAVFATYMQFFSTVASKMRWKASKAKLFLFANERDYMHTLKTRFDNDGTGSWGKYFPSGRMLVGWRGEHSIAEMKPLLQHEGLHQAVRQLFGDVPTWANEGLAELFERGVVVDRKLVLGGFPPHDKKRLLKFHETNELMPFDRFFLISGEEWSAKVRAEDAKSIYPQAWSLIDFLVYSENRKYEKNFQMFLFGLSRGMPWEKAFANAYGNINIGAMEGKWLKYIKNKNPTDYELTARRLDFLANGMLRLHEQHNLPVSLEDLRNKLQKMGFSYVSDIHGKKRKMSAHDNANYRIPYGSNSKDHGFFLVDKKFRQPNENTFPNKPTLLNIATSGLEPNALVLTWRRSKGKYDYQIEAKPSNIVRVKSTGKNIASKAARGNRADASQTGGKDRTIREWKSKSSGHTVKADFLERKGTNIQLKREDGTVITVPVAKLSEEDQTYLESIQD